MALPDDRRQRTRRGHDGDARRPALSRGVAVYGCELARNGRTRCSLPEHYEAPAGWQVLELNSAQVTEQRRVAGRRRDGAISREGSVELRRALIDLGVGLWHCDPAARVYAATLKARGKPGGVIACALAHRATRIAFALTREQAPYDPARWA